MKDYPKNVGKELSLNYNLFNCNLIIEDLSNLIFQIYSKRLILLYLSFLENLIENSIWNLILSNSINKLFNNFELFIEELEEIKNLELFLEFSKNFNKFNINEELFLKIKKIIIQISDELYIRLNLISQNKNNKIIEILTEIINNFNF